MNHSEFSRKRAAFPIEDLIPFERQYVAWSEDGDRILASASEMNDLYQLIDQRGITNYVVDYILAPDEVDLGGQGLDLLDPQV